MSRTKIMIGQDDKDSNYLLSQTKNMDCKNIKKHEKETIRRVVVSIKCLYIIS